MTPTVLTPPALPSPPPTVNLLPPPPAPTPYPSSYSHRTAWIKVSGTTEHGFGWGAANATTDRSGWAATVALAETQACLTATAHFGATTLVTSDWLPAQIKRYGGRNITSDAAPPDEVRRLIDDLRNGRITCITYAQAARHTSTRDEELSARARSRAILEHTRAQAAPLTYVDGSFDQDSGIGAYAYSDGTRFSVGWQHLPSSQHTELAGVLAALTAHEGRVITDALSITEVATRSDAIHRFLTMGLSPVDAETLATQAGRLSWTRRRSTRLAIWADDTARATLRLVIDGRLTQPTIPAVHQAA